MKNCDLGLLGQSNLDPIYVIYVFGSMLSCILCERQKISESHKLKRSGSWNQFRAARLVTVLIIARSINRMKWVVENYCVCGLGTTNSQEMTSDRWFLTSSEMSVLQASHVKGQHHAENDQVQLWKIVFWDHSDHQIWTPYMWSMSLDRCSPVFSVRDKHFQKVTNWSALVPEISSAQRDLWPFRIFDLVWMQWN